MCDVLRHRASPARPGRSRSADGRRSLLVGPVGRRRCGSEHHRPLLLVGEQARSFVVVIRDSTPHDHPKPCLPPFPSNPRTSLPHQPPEPAPRRTAHLNDAALHLLLPLFRDSLRFPWPSPDRSQSLDSSPREAQSVSVQLIYPVYPCTSSICRVQRLGAGDSDHGTGHRTHCATGHGRIPDPAARLRRRSR